MTEMVDSAEESLFVPMPGMEDFKRSKSGCLYEYR